MRPKQERYAALEQEMEAALSEQSALEAELADPEVYADSARTTELLKRFGEIRDKGEHLLEKLAELEAEIAKLEARRAELSVTGGE